MDPLETILTLCPKTKKCLSYSVRYKPTSEGCRVESVINFAFFLHTLEPVIFHFYVLFLATTRLNICGSTVILTIQVQLPNSEVLASCSADFTCFVIKSLSPSLSVVQLFTNLKTYWTNPIEVCNIPIIFLITRDDHEHTSNYGLT